MTNLFTNLLQWPVIVFLWQEVNVSWRDDSHQLAAHFTSFGDRDAGEAVPYLSLEHVANRVPRAHHHWICDKALLKFLPWSHSTGWWLDTSSVSVLRDSRASKSLSFTLTFRTSFAWNSGVQLWWMMPIPPMSWHTNQKKKNTSQEPYYIVAVIHSEVTVTMPYTVRTIRNKSSFKSDNEQMD